MLLRFLSAYECTIGHSLLKPTALVQYAHSIVLLTTVLHVCTYQSLSLSPYAYSSTIYEGHTFLATPPGHSPLPIQEVVVCLASMPSFWLLLAAGSIRNIPGYAIGAWLPTFYALEHDVRPSSYGVRVGLVIVFGGGLGSFLGGFLADR